MSGKGLIRALSGGAKNAFARWCALAVRVRRTSKKTKVIGFEVELDDFLYDARELSFEAHSYLRSRDRELIEAMRRARLKAFRSFAFSALRYAVNKDAFGAMKFAHKALASQEKQTALLNDRLAVVFQYDQACRGLSSAPKGVEVFVDQVQLGTQPAWPAPSEILDFSRPQHDKQALLQAVNDKVGELWGERRTS